MMRGAEIQGKSPVRFRLAVIWGSQPTACAFQVALQLSLLLAAPSAADWSQWRGPDRNGLLPRSPSLVNAFTATSPIWKSEPIVSGDLGGRGSLVIHDQRVYGITSSPVDKEGTTELFCLHAAEGRTLWKAPLSTKLSSDTGSATPCIAGGRVFVAGSDNQVHCLNAENGVPLWSRELPRSNQQPIASSVAIVDGVAVLLADVLTGLDPATGNVLWTQGDIDGCESSPARWDSVVGQYVICNSRLKTHCVNPVDGTILWSVPGGGKSTPVVSQEYGGEFLVNMSGSRRSGLSAYRLTNSGPQKLWTMRAFDRAASPVVYDGHAYAIAGGSNGHGARILCLHLDTGQVAWEENITFAEVSSPVVADGKLIAICGTQLWLLQATPERYSVLSQTDLQITLCTSPAIHNGVLYLRHAGVVACYDLRATP